MALYGPNDDHDHVLWSQVCRACQETKSRCTAPSDANAAHIVHCVNNHDALVEFVEQVAEWDFVITTGESSKALVRTLARQLLAKVRS